MTARPARPRRRVRGTLAALAAAVALGGCGIPTDAQPRALARSGIPFGLLQDGNVASTTTVPNRLPPNEVLVHVYLIGPTGHLVARDRVIPLPLGPGLDAVLDALFSGPDTVDRDDGLQTSIPPQTKVISTTITGGIATIDLDSTMNQLVGPAQIQAVAQVVYTATDTNPPGVSGVAFEFNGQPALVPVALGSQMPFVGRAQYLPLAPDGS